MIINLFILTVSVISNSPYYGNHRNSKEAVNEMKWKQLKEKRAPVQTEYMSVCHCHCLPAPQLLITPKHNNTIGD